MMNEENEEINTKKIIENELHNCSFYGKLNINFNSLKFTRIHDKIICITNEFSSDAIMA